MRHPRARRPRHVFRWQGFVVELDSGTVWARLIGVDHDFPEVLAEFDRRHFPGAREGSLFSMYVHRRGRKVRTVIRVGVRPWTQPELDQINGWVKSVATEWLANVRT